MADDRLRNRLLPQGGTRHQTWIQHALWTGGSQLPPPDRLAVPAAPRNRGGRTSGTGGIPHLQRRSRAANGDSLAGGSAFTDCGHLFRCGGRSDHHRRVPDLRDPGGYAGGGSTAERVVNKESTEQTFDLSVLSLFVLV